MNPKNQEYGKLINAGEVRFVRLLPGPIERVWTYLTDPEKRGLWLASGSADLRVGGKVSLEFDNSNLTSHAEEAPAKYREHSKDGCGAFTGTITRCEPPRLLSHTWGESNGGTSEVTFELTPQGGEVQLVLTHRKIAGRDMLMSVAGGWHTHLAILIAKLEGAAPPPFWSTHARLEKEYEMQLEEALATAA